MKCDEFLESVLENPTQGSRGNEHLASCQRCRAMMEVLSPLMWATESDAPSHSFLDLNVSPQPESVRLAADVANRLSCFEMHAVEQAKSVQATRKDLTWRYAIAFLAGAVASLAGVFTLNSSAVPMQTMNSTACLLGDEGISQMKSESLVRACVACHLVASQ